MSKKRRRQISAPPSPPSTPDARRIVAARAVKALRSDEAAKLRENVIHRFTQEVLHDVNSKVRKPRFSSRESVPPSVSERRLPSYNELRNARLQPQVRRELQDAVRGLACNARKTRKEVLFAMRKTGKAGRRNRKAHWTDKSHLRCK